MHVYAIWLALVLVSEEPGRKRRLAAFGFAAVCWMAGLSNLMFFPHTLAPLAVGVVLLVLVRALSVRRAASVIASGWPATIAGAVAFRLFFPAMDLGAQSTLGIEAWTLALRTFGIGLRDALAVFEIQHIAALVF